MFSAYIVDGVRTAGGKRNGALSQWHSADLGALVVDALVERTKVPAAEIDDVIWGCVSQVGSQGANLGRNVVLSSKILPESVPGTTVDRQCGSSAQAFTFACQAVMSGTMDIIVAGGSETMSSVPIGSSVMDGVSAGHGQPWDGEGVQARYGEGVSFSQFEGAELTAQRYKVSRAEMDQFAVLSHKRAAEATASGAFAKEIVPVSTNLKGDIPVFDKDEGIRPSTTLEGLAKLKTLAGEGGLITAGTSSQITDGASCILIVNDRALKKHPHLKVRAVVRCLVANGSEPKIMLDGPVLGVALAFKRLGLTADQIDAFEINEAFASVPLAVAKTHKIPLEKLNIHGGAMALGHALGSTGTRCITTLLNILEQRGGRFGLFGICEGGGTANVVVIERISAPVPVTPHPIPARL